MASKARRIPDSLWEKHKDEITALYSAPKGTLKETMQTMMERHDFHATKNQYTTKFKAWGLEKYASHNIWAYAYQKKRKRKLLGKDTEFEIRGKRRSNSEVDEYIARHVTYTQRLQLAEDIHTPEGVQAFTPVAEASDVTVREVCIDNLPSFRLMSDIHEFLSQIMSNQTSQLSPIFAMLALPGKYISPRLHSSSSVAELVFEDTLKLFPESERHKIMEKKSFLTSHLLPTYINNYEAPFSNFEVSRTSSLLALHCFMWQLIFSIKSGERYASFKTVDWMLENVGSSLLCSLFRLETIAVQIFMRKIFRGVVKSGNTTIAKNIIDRNIDIKSHNASSGLSYYEELQENCMTIAVGNRDNRMVELLCQAGFPPRISVFYEQESKTLPWRTGDLGVLETLLSFELDPECLVHNRMCGFPLVDAANSGSLDAVNMLWMAGCRINVYLPRYFGTPLQAAVSGGHLQTAQFLIEHGADVNAPCGTNYVLSLPEGNYYRGSLASTPIKEPSLVALKTPIEIACNENNTLLAKMLLAHGALADPSPLSHFAGALPPLYDDVIWIRTALQYSVQNRNIDLVRLLLSLRADPNSRGTSNWGDAPLQIAARHNYPEIAQVLVNYKANVNDPPARLHGRTAIQAAAETGNVQLVRILLSRNANINAPACENNGFTALQAAIKNNHFSTARLLLMAGADVNAPAATTEGLTAIQAAARFGDLNLIKYLVEHGADVNRSPSKYGGITAVNAALIRENMLMLEFLVEHGAVIDGNKNEMTPIMQAAKSGWIEGARYLLQKGADINATNNYESPLTLSIRNNDTEMVDFLLKSARDLNFLSVGRHSTDALYLALHQMCSHELILLLLSKYTVSGPNYFDQEVLAASTSFVKKDTSMLRIIMRAVSELPKALYEVQVRNAWHEFELHSLNLDESVVVEIINILLDAGYDINCKLKREYTTLLQGFISLEYFEASRNLVKRVPGIQIPAIPASREGDALLQDAIFDYDIEFAYFLLEHGADVNAPPAAHGGRTALQAALEGGHNDLVSNLLKRDADVNASPAEKWGVTALQAAAITDNMDVAILLIQHGAYVAAPAAPFNGRTAINGAAERGNLEILQLLLNHYDGCEDLSEVCQNAASYAEKEGHFEIARWLRGFRPDQ